MCPSKGHSIKYMYENFIEKITKKVCTYVSKKKRKNPIDFPQSFQTSVYVLNDSYATFYVHM